MVGSLCPAQGREQAFGVAREVTVKPQCVVDLVGLARGDQFTDRLHSGFEGGLVCVGCPSSCGKVTASGSSGRVGFFESRECGQRHSGITETAKRVVEGWRRVVAEESNQPQPTLRLGFDSIDSCADVAEFGGHKMSYRVTKLQPSAPLVRIVPNQRATQKNRPRIAAGREVGHTA